MLDESIAFDMWEGIVGPMLWDVHAANVKGLESINIVGHTPHSQNGVGKGDINILIRTLTLQDLNDLSEILLAGYKERLLGVWDRLLKATDNNLVQASIQPPSKSNGSINIVLTFLSGASQQVTIL